MKRKQTWLSNKEFAGSYSELDGVILVSGDNTVSPALVKLADPLVSFQILCGLLKSS